MYQELIKQRQREFDVAFERAKSEAASIRTSRASPDMVADLRVDYLGMPLALKEIAAITTPEPRSILIQPWDKQAIAGIEKAIRESSLGLSPVVDGTGIRLTVPPLSEERRKEYVKLLGQKVEEARIRIRQIREDILKKVQTAVKEKTAREDENRQARDALQKIVDETHAKLQELQHKKEQEIMSV